MAGAFAEVSPLTFNLQADAWRRIVQALIEAKLFDETFVNAQDFFNKCNDITMPAEELIIKEADIEVAGIVLTIREMAGTVFVNILKVIASIATNIITINMIMSPSLLRRALPFLNQKVPFPST